VVLDKNEPIDPIPLKFLDLPVCLPAYAVQYLTAIQFRGLGTVACPSHYSHRLFWRIKR
jgi:hypothetical protein